MPWWPHRARNRWRARAGAEWHRGPPLSTALDSMGNATARFEQRGFELASRIVNRRETAVVVQEQEKANDVIFHWALQAIRPASVPTGRAEQCTTWDAGSLSDRRSERPTTPV